MIFPTCPIVACAFWARARISWYEPFFGVAFTAEITEDAVSLANAGGKGFADRVQLVSLFVSVAGLGRGCVLALEVDDGPEKERLKVCDGLFESDGAVDAPLETGIVRCILEETPRKSFSAFRFGPL